MCAISVAPRGEDRTQEEANRLTWESFIVLQESKTADEQQHRAFINNLLYSRDGNKKFIDVLNEDFRRIRSTSMVEDIRRNTSCP